MTCSSPFPYKSYRNVNSSSSGWGHLPQCEAGWPQCLLRALFGKNVCKNERIRSSGGGGARASGTPWIRHCLCLHLQGRQTRLHPTCPQTTGPNSFIFAEKHPMSASLNGSVPPLEILDPQIACQLYCMKHQKLLINLVTHFGTIDIMKATCLRMVKALKSRARSYHMYMVKWSSSVLSNQKKEVTICMW